MAHMGVVAPNKKKTYYIYIYIYIYMSRLLDTCPLNNVARNLLLEHDAYTENHVSCKTIFFPPPPLPPDVANCNSEVLNR